MASNKTIFAVCDSVEFIEAAASEAERKGPKQFNVLAYTGGILPGALLTRSSEGIVAREDVVIDLSGVEFGKSLVANLDHDPAKRVGHITATQNDGRTLAMSGFASAATASRDEVVASAASGFVWQASVEGPPKKLEKIAAGKTVTVNGQEFTGPIYVARKSLIKGFAFVSHGADDDTFVQIAAQAASHSKGADMKPEVKAWAEKMLLNVDDLTPEQAAAIEAQYNGLNAKPAAAASIDASNEFEVRKAERDRREQLKIIATEFADRRPHDIEGIEKMHDQAVATKMGPRDFRMALLEATLPEAHTVFSPRQRDPGVNSKVIEAAICVQGRLKGHEQMFDDKTLQAAHDHFKHGIGLKELFIRAAQAAGHQTSGYNVTIETQRAAFGLGRDRTINASGFSTISLPNTLASVANKFIRDGWNAVDQTALRIAAITPVNDFKQRSTVSLTADMKFEKVGKDGEIKHGTLGEETYTNQAETYARMLAITRQDLVNDDLGALTSIPRRLGRGAMLKLNEIFWTEFLDNSSFFAAGNNNVSTGAGSALGLAGLGAAEVKFRNQTDPNGFPLGVMPRILLVPPTLYATAATLMNSQMLMSGSTTAAGSSNIWAGRFQVESSPYMESTAFTGNSSAAWYLLADPNDVPVIEIVALNGRLEPTIDSADADFNVLGVQFRGFSDVGVAKQEPRGGVRSAGS